MTKVIALFGAGTGLAASVARRYGRHGYSVALVARNAGKLEDLASSIKSGGIETATFVADLSVTEQVSAAVEAIRARFGRIDILYYAPNPVDQFVPATEVTQDILQQRLALYLFGLVAAVNAVLPELRKRGAGRILSGFGGTAQVGFPFMSGTGPAMAAARNYLQSLQKELVSEGIEVGIVTITAVVRNSAFHQGLQAERGQEGSHIATQFPEADPDHLASLLDEAAADPERLEASFPPA